MKHISELAANVVIALAGMAAGHFIYQWTKQAYPPFWHTVTVLALAAFPAVSLLTRRSPPHVAALAWRIVTGVVLVVLAYPLLRLKWL
ncbi:MAG: hypothetical protein ACOY93_08430 [Bacillota bacterium]